MRKRLHVLISLFLVLIYLFNVLNAAGAPVRGDGDSGGADGTEPPLDTFEKYVLENMMVEHLITLLLTLIMFSFKVSVLYDNSLLYCERNTLNSIHSGFTSYIMYINRVSMATPEKSQMIRELIDDCGVTPINSVNDAAKDGTKKVLDTIVKNLSLIHI